MISVLLDSKVMRVDEMNKAGYSAVMLAALCTIKNETELAIIQRLFNVGNVNAKALKVSPFMDFFEIFENLPVDLPVFLNY